MPLANVIMSRSIDQFNIFDFLCNAYCTTNRALISFHENAYMFLLYCMTSNQFSDAGLALI